MFTFPGIEVYLINLIIFNIYLKAAITIATIVIIVTKTIIVIIIIVDVIIDTIAAATISSKTNHVSDTSDAVWTTIWTVTSQRLSDTRVNDLILIWMGI